MASVTFDPAVGGDGSTVTDDNSPTTGLKAGGHRLRFVPALTQLVAVCAWMVAYITAQAAVIAGYASAALGGASTQGTSTSNVSAVAAGGTFTVTTQTGKLFFAGMKLAIVRTSAPTTVAMYGTCTGYVSGTGVLTMVPDDSTGVAGPFTDWTIGASAGPGVAKTRAINTSGLATGGGNLTADRTIDVARAQTAAVRTGTTTAQAMTPGDTYAALAEVTLTDAATVTPDFGAGLNFVLTATSGIGATRQLANPTNTKVGQCGYIRYQQDGVGSRALTFGSAWKREGGAPTASTAASAEDVIFYEVLTSSRIVYSLVKAPS